GEPRDVLDRQRAGPGHAGEDHLPDNAGAGGIGRAGVASLTRVGGRLSFALSKKAEPGWLARPFPAREALSGANAPSPTTRDADAIMRRRTKGRGTCNSRYQS